MAKLVAILMKNSEIWNFELNEKFFLVNFQYKWQSE